MIAVLVVLALAVLAGVALLVGAIKQHERRLGAIENARGPSLVVVVALLDRVHRVPAAGVGGRPHGPSAESSVHLGRLRLPQGRSPRRRITRGAALGWRSE
jgi:hypothetical protein